MASQIPSNKFSLARTVAWRQGEVEKRELGDKETIFVPKGTQIPSICNAT